MSDTPRTDKQARVRMNISDLGVTEEMVRAGDEIAAACYDASVDKCLNNTSALQLDGIKNKDLVEAYVENEITSVTAIYAAMQRAKE